MSSPPPADRTPTGSGPKFPGKQGPPPADRTPTGSGSKYPDKQGQPAPTTKRAVFPGAAASEPKPTTRSGPVLPGSSTTKSIPKIQPSKLPPKLTIIKIAVLAVVVVTGLSMYIVSFKKAQNLERKAMCESNLRTLHQLGQLCTFKAAGKRFPAETGGSYWLKVVEMQNQSHTALHCPIARNTVAGQTSYRGPAQDINDLADEDIIGADVAGNHGAGKGGTIILKDGVVRDAAEGSEDWKRAETTTKP